MITPTKNNSLKGLCISLFISLVFLQNSSAQISFSQSDLNFNGNGNVNSGVTSMSFGPDNRLYVTEYTGAVKILSIERTGPTNYTVTNLETLNGILTIQDYNDDGTPNNAIARETIGIAVGGSAANPVFYVSSSDIRIGAGSGGGNGDVGLDTNSGIITRFSWNGTSWDAVDIVRGLPRSEENHATNGLELATINGTNYLIVAQGGHANGGAPSTNFVYTCEYALSAAVLSIDLDMLNAMTILNDNGRSYIYDLPTLDDPTRPNVNGITDPDDPGYDGVDLGDPFGGNDGLNMAIIDPAGPVQILSPGYRNAYDLVVTESGALYVTDNGANQGWGGLPENEGTANVTNDYNPSEPGSTASNPAPSGESVDNVDHLQLVTTDLNTYTFNSLYGGHPNPIRANPQGAGLYTDNTSALGTFGSPIWRTQIYDPNGSRPNSTMDPNEGLPANWPPVPSANPVEGDWRGPTVFNPDGPQDNPVVTWGTNTNSIDEYTASNFGGVLKGNLMAGHSSGNIRRVILSPDGASGTLTPNFFSGIGGNVLGLTCNGDTDIFPGTVWAGTLNGKIVVMEPQDAVDCIAPNDPAYDPLADYDDDGYTNQDEVDNGTDPCNGGSQPSDFDKVLGPPFISDLNDSDDDGDGIPDSQDPFQLGNPLAIGSQAFTIPIANDLFNDQQGLGGIFGLGLTGLMNNSDTGPNWLNWIDRRDDPNDPNPNDVLGGAPGIMTSHMTSGTALGTANNQEKGYQYGVQVDSNTAPFSVIGGMNGFSGSDLRLYGNTAAIGGELGFFIGDGTQSNYIKFVVNVDGFTVLQEIGDVPQIPVNITIAELDRPSGSIRFYFVINPSTGAVSCDYQIDDNPRTNITTLTAEGAVLEALQQNTKDLAVGFIGTSGVDGVELEGSWDFLNVLGSQPITVSELPDINRLVGSDPESINLNSYFTDDGGSGALTYTVETNSDPSISAIITNSNLDLVFPITPALSLITIRATDADTNFVEQSFTVNITEEPFVLYRVNAGGPEIIAIDDDINWSADTAGANSEFLVVAGSNSTFNATPTSTTGAVDTGKVPISIFETERYDSAPGQPNLTYAFPVAENGNYEVRLYMMNSFNGTSQPGQRIFNATVEGNFYPELLNIDLSARYGHQVGAVISQIVPVNDGVIDITLLHDIENPLINGIEILKASSINTPIYVNTIDDQLSFPGEALDGSLGVVATGGDGNLQFSTVGLPPGVTIDPTNGQIGGTVGIDTADNSPYLVTITIDDSDAISSDALTLQFTWVVETLAFAIEPIENLNSFIDDAIDFTVVTSGGDPNETITFAIQNQPDGISIDATTGIISGTLASGAELGGPNSDGIYNVTVTATGSVSGTVNVPITWTVSEKQLVFFRLNAGGNAVASTDGELNWVANNTTGAVSGAGYTVNTGSISTSGLTYANRHVSIPSYIDEAIYNAIFAQERWDPPSGAEMQFEIPLTNGDYIVNLYMGNSYALTSQVGQRVFDISIEGILVKNNLDLITEFGHQSGGMLSFPITLTDGVINILFEHITENPLVNAIEVIQQSFTNNQPPNAVVSANPITGEAPLNITFTGSDSTDDSNSIASYFWDFGNGDSSSETNPNYTFNQAGTYEVTLTVYDEEGLSDTETITINVIETGSCLWSDLANSNLSKLEAQSAKIGDKLYVFAGFLAGLQITGTTEIYDSTANSWSIGTSMPIPVTHMGVAVVGTDIWIIGGFEGNHPGVAINNVQIYNTLTDSWSEGPNLPAQRASGASTFNNGKIHYFGGLLPDRVTDVGEHYVLDLNNQAAGWIQLADLPNPRNHLSAASINGLVYAIGGQYGHDNGVADQKFLDVYNPLSNQWTRLADLPVARSHFEPGTIVHNNKIIIVGGRQGNIFFDDITEYDPLSNQWSERCKLPEKLLAPAAKVFGDKLIVANGGINGISNPTSTTRSIYIEPESQFPPLTLQTVFDQNNQVGESIALTFIASGGNPNEDVSYAISGQPAGLIVETTSGQILGTINPSAVNGGPNNDGIHEVTITASKPGSTAVTEQFLWTVTPSFTNLWFSKNENETYTARHECSFVQAGDKFYLFGGRENAQTIDIYDYSTNSWTALVNSAPFEFNHFQALEYQGLIWVIGAYKTNSFPSEIPADYIWAFNPATQEWIQGPEIPPARKRGSTGLAIYNDKFYILAGNTNGHSGGYVNWFDEYDPATGTWTVLADAPRARDHFHTAIINGKLYAASGRLSGGTGGVFAPVISEVDVYDFATESWSTLPNSQNIPTPRAGAIVANFENKLIVAGGESLASLSAFNTTEIFDPVSQSWSIGAPLIHQRHGTQGIVSGNGIFIAGGSPVRGGGNQKNMEFYGQDNPVGLPSVASILTAEPNLDFEVGETKTLSITSSGGNVGAIIKNMTLSGNNASEFIIDSGNVAYKLIEADASHDLSISYLGTDFTEKNAILTIFYNNSDSLIINLSVLGYGLIYNETVWSPSAPNQTTSAENALILNGSYAVNSDIEINNLSVRNGATLIVEAGKSITAHGDLKINGTLELQSTSTSYSSLITDGTVEGNVVYKRHVHRTAAPGQSDANDLIAPPLSGQTFNDFLVNNPNIVSNSTNTLYLFGPFNKTTGAYDIYSNTEDADAPLEAGIGYRAASTDTSTFTFTGNVNTGPIAIPIINSGPFYQVWNLIGNPYPSYINAAAFLSANTTEFAENSAAIYGYDGDASDGWVIWNQAYADSNSVTLISPGQGFFVTSKPTGGTVNFAPSMRSKGDSDDFIAGRNSSNLPSYLKLNLSQNEKSYHTDFYFNPKASRGLDKGYDAEVWGGNAPNFSIFSYLVEENTGSPMAIQSLGETDYSDLLIPLGIKANLGDQLTVSIAETTLPNTVDVYLEDYLLQTSTLLNNSDYILTPINSLHTLGRFYLSFTDRALSTKVSNLNTLNVFSNAQNQSIIITGVITEPTVAKLYDIQGRLVMSKSLNLNTSQQHIDARHLDKGVYVISIANHLEKMTKKIIIR